MRYSPDYVSVCEIQSPTVEGAQAWSREPVAERTNKDRRCDVKRGWRRSRTQHVSFVVLLSTAGYLFVASVHAMQTLSPQRELKAPAKLQTIRFAIVSAQALAMTGTER